jgi:exoribonuclease-2
LIACRPGDLIEIWDEGALLSGVVIAEEKGRLRVVTERGEEIRVASSRVALVADRNLTVEPRRAAEAAARHAAEVKRLGGEIDVASLWEILVDDGGRHAIEDLAGLAFQAPSAANASALFVRLAEERTWFERRGEIWEARSRAAVEETLKRHHAAAEKAARREAFLARARLLIGSEDPPAGIAPDPADALFIRKLVDFAVHGEAAPDRKEGVALLDDLRPGSAATPAAAFDLLVRLGVFDPDENLDIHRYGLRTEFPPEVEEAARSAAAGGALEGRRDLTSLAAFTVDDAETVEIDDALSWEEEAGGGGVAGIHIADPSAFVRPGDLVDDEAMKRAATHYFPERRLPMIPAAISEGAASLAAGRLRPALSTLVRVDAAGKVTGSEIVASIVRSRARLTYEETDAILAGGTGAADRGLRPSIAALHALASSLERERAAAGAILIRAPEVIVKVAPGGRVTLTRLDERGPSRRLVAELMILANRIAAAFCSERRIPAIYRRQPAPERPPAPIPEGAYDPVAVRNLRRSLRRGETSLAPDLHYALGLPAYLQATSPIRRYQDLAVQRQIEAHLAGTPLPYDGDAIARIAATTEEAERDARRAEAAADDYWILKFLAGKVGEEIEGTIVAVEARRTEVELTETLRSAAIAPRPDHAPGKTLRLIVDGARPREGDLRLREI